MQDGVLPPVKYLNASTKIFWILKEPYGDLPKHLGDDIQGRIDGKKMDSPHTWQRIALTSYLILNECKIINQIPGWDQYGTSLNQIAIINLKKHSGKSRTKMHELRRYYRERKETLLPLIKYQIESINPQLIIGGGTLQ